jgi:hypothetical protein
VLTPVGGEFDVLCAPTLLATVAAGLPMFRENLGPLAMSPQGARFLVTPGAVLDPDMVGQRGVEILRHGAFLPLLLLLRSLPGRALNMAILRQALLGAEGRKFGGQPDAKTDRVRGRASRTVTGCLGGWWRLGWAS